MSYVLTIAFFQFYTKFLEGKKSETEVQQVRRASIAFSYLAGLVVEPNQGVVPGQHLAVEGGVVLGRPAPSHRPADLDGLIQVHMALLERVRVGSAGEHGQRRRH